MQDQFERTVSLDCNPDAWADGQLVVFVACDMAYLGEAIVLLRSMDLLSPGFDFLLHLVNPSEDAIAGLENLGRELTGTRLHLSAEKVRFASPDHKKPYYASARFIRLAEVLSRSAVPMLVLDADGVFVAPIDLDFTDKAEAEICLKRRDIEGEKEEHLQVAAGAVWTRPSLAACEYFEAVAADLLNEFRAGSAAWYVDQKLLARHLKAIVGDNPAVRNIKGKYADWAFGDESIIWTGKGNRKYVDVRYLLLRLGYDDDPIRRLRARRLLVESISMIPPKERGSADQRVLQVMRASRKPRFAIYLPRLDLPWKKSGMSKGGPVAPTDDAIEMRLWWKRFAMELALTMTRYEAEPDLIEIPAWDITPKRIDEGDHDLAFVPHRCRLDFERRTTPVMFYMQEFFRHVFVADPGGWGAASSAYPVDPQRLPPAVLGAWDDYRARFTQGTLGSKFGQAPSQSRAALVDARQIPESSFAFFPLQVPHDQSLEYFSDVDQMQALQAVADWAKDAGVALVLKEHPANRPSMAEFRARFSGPGITWSEAHVHDLLRHSRGVITLNSGVGFEAILAGRPLVTLARGMYDTIGVAASTSNIAESWRAAVAEDEDERMQRYARFVDWYLSRHAVDMSRPSAARYSIDRIVSRALAMADKSRGLQ